MAKVKLIWDFRGPAAKQTAAHHCIHLKEFIAIEKIDGEAIRTEIFSEMYVCVSMIIPKKDVTFMRMRLKPHRGKRVQES